MEDRPNMDQNGRFDREVMIIMIIGTRGSLFSDSDG